MKKMKRILVLIMALIMLVSVAACNGGDETPEATPDAAPETTPDAAPVETPEPTIDPSLFATPRPDWVPKNIPDRNLGGIEIIISDWWTDNDAERDPPQNLRDEQWEDRLYDLEYEHGFTIKQMSTSAWADYMELFTTSVMAGDPSADIFVMSDAWAMQLMNQGLLYPLNTLDSIDVFDPKWNPGIVDQYTKDGNVYAISADNFPEPRNFLFFNKRMFEEAGIDPEEPYNLQAEGKWTWDVFEEYCKKLTRDTTGDGIIDKWALTGFEYEVAHGFVYSNNARYIGVNPDGTFYNAMTEPNFVEAMQFVKKLHDEGYTNTTGPEGASWDWFLQGFTDGHCAMIFREVWDAPRFQTMDDDWGVVFAPMGPKAIDYCTYFSQNVYVLPFNIDKEKAEDFMYALHQYNMPLPYDLTNPGFWKDGGWGYSRYRDMRSVDDTIAMFYDGRGVINNRSFISGIDWGPTFDWGCVHGAETAQEKIESSQPIVDAAIEETNRILLGG